MFVLNSALIKSGGNKCVFVVLIWYHIISMRVRMYICIYARMDVSEYRVIFSFRTAYGGSPVWTFAQLSRCLLINLRCRPACTWPPTPGHCLPCSCSLGRWCERKGDDFHRLSQILRSASNEFFPYTFKFAARLAPHYSSTFLCSMSKPVRPAFGPWGLSEERRVYRKWLCCCNSWCLRGTSLCARRHRSARTDYVSCALPRAYLRGLALWVYQSWLAFGFFWVNLLL